MRLALIQHHATARIEANLRRAEEATRRTPANDRSFTMEIHGEP